MTTTTTIAVLALVGGVGTQAGVADKTQPVAIIRGVPIHRADCRAPSAGIGSVEVGLDLLIHRAMLEEFARREPIAVRPADIRDYLDRVAEVRGRSAADSKRPGPPTSPFDARATEAEAAEVREALTRPGISILERAILRDRAEGLRAALEFRDRDAATAVDILATLKFCEAIYRRDGGKVVADGLGSAPVEAIDTLRRSMEAAGMIRLLDPGLEAALRRRWRDALESDAVIPPEKVRFRRPAFLDRP